METVLTTPAVLKKTVPDKSVADCTPWVSVVAVPGVGGGKDGLWPHSVPEEWFISQTTCSVMGDLVNCYLHLRTIVFNYLKK